MSLFDDERTVHHESSGKSSAEDLDFFRDWKKRHPEHNWVAVSIDRYDGTMLYCQHEDQTIALHFAHLVCGFNGSGPKTAVQLISEAGFNYVNVIAALVYKEPALMFTK